MTSHLTALNNALGTCDTSLPVGIIHEISGGFLRASGLADVAHIGDTVVVRRQSGVPVRGEIVQIEGNSVDVLPDGAPEGVALNDKVVLQPGKAFAPGDHWIGRVVDPFGSPLDGRPLFPGSATRDILGSPPPAAMRAPLGPRMNSGLVVMNTLLPIVRGQRIGLFAGSGVGKSRLLAKLATNMEADVVVVALIGERGREVNEFVTNVLGETGMSRSVVVAATSDQSALLRRRCAWSAQAIAEHFRDQGRSVLLLADSITRFAEAHREVATAMGEAPALRGFPPSLAPLVAGLCERAGTGRPGQGTITAIYSVLVAGSDMEEPVADILRGVLDGHIVLSRDIAERGRFPAIDVGQSVSRALPEAASALENQMINDARKLLGIFEQSEIMVKSGLYSEGADKTLDQAVRIWPELDALIARDEVGSVKDSFDRLELVLRRVLGPLER